MGMINLSNHVCSKCEHMDRRDRTIHGRIVDRVRESQQIAHERYKKYKWPPQKESQGGFDLDDLLRFEQARRPEIYKSTNYRFHRSSTFYK